MEPCGTPEVTVGHSDPTPPITTLCARLVRKAFIYAGEKWSSNTDPV